VEQARDVAEEERQGLPERAFRGPDVFCVTSGVDPDRRRKSWIAWEEGGRLPDVIFEMLSPSTAKKDRTEKRDLYARVFRTPEYFLYEPETHKLEGLRLADRFYQPIQPDENGRLWRERWRPTGSGFSIPTAVWCSRRPKPNNGGPIKRSPSSHVCAPSSKSTAGAEVPLEFLSSTRNGGRSGGGPDHRAGSSAAQRRTKPQDSVKKARVRTRNRMSSVGSMTPASPTGH
jgi:hypothetical protein